MIAVQLGIRLDPSKRCRKVPRLQIPIPHLGLEVLIAYGQCIAETATIIMQQGAAAPLTVNKATPTIPDPTLNTTSPISLGGSATAAVTISGVSGVTPTGFVTFQYSADSGSTWIQLGSIKTVSGASLTSDPYTPIAVGSTNRIQAVYSGDDNYNSVTGAATSLTVNKANAVVSVPFVSPNPVFVNNGVTVSVTISGFSGGATPTGTATFQIKIGSGLWTTIGPAVSLNNGGASTTYVPQTVDTYQFQAVYSGDNNYNGATGDVASVASDFAPLDHFIFNSVGTQTVGTSFSITVLAKDAYGNTVTGYTGAPSLTYSAGSISPQTMNSFVNGVGSIPVTVDTSGSSVNIIVIDGNHSGTSNSFTVTITPTPTTTPEPNQTTTPTQASTPLPTSRTTSTPKPTPTSTSQVSPTATPTPSNSTSVSPSPSSSGINLNNTIKIEFPLSFLDISLFLAFLSIILLPTSKLLPRYYQMVTPLIHKLEAAAVLVSILFLLTVAIQVAMAILNL